MARDAKLEAALEKYYATNPLSVQSFEGIFAYLIKEGFQVARATHGAGDTLASDDALVTASGDVYDVIQNVGSPNQRWNIKYQGTYRTSRKVIDPTTGANVGFTDWTAGLGSTSGAPGPKLGDPGYQEYLDKTYPIGGPGPYPGGPNARAPKTPQEQALVDYYVRKQAAQNAPPAGSQPPASPNIYADAQRAAMRQRGKAKAGGRQGTILGGFSGGRPKTAPATILGSRY